MGASRFSWAFVLPLALLNGGCDLLEQHKVLAIALDVRGDVIIGGRRWKNGDSKLMEGHPLTTGSGAEALLSLSPGIRVQVTENSEIEIGPIIIAKRGNAVFDGMKSRAARITLRHGSLRGSLPRIQHQARTELAVETPRGTLEASAGSLFIAKSDGHATDAACVRGAVLFISPERTEKLEPGLVYHWSSAAGETSHGPLAFDPQWQGEVSAALDAEQSANSLEIHRQNFLP
jgi:hypothetical protein